MDKTYRTEPVPKSRRFSFDAGRLGRGKHIIHGLFEVDITDARQIMRAYEARTNEKPSLTAFIIFCLAKAIESNDHLNAYLDWRRRLVIYHDVNINMLLEASIGGSTVPIPIILQAVNKKDYLEVHTAVRSAQSSPGNTRGAGFMRRFLRLPWIMRRPFYWIVLSFPQVFREYSSPVLVTAVGMFGKGAGWGIPMPNFTLTVTLGGAAEKPAVINGEIKPRELLDVTVSIDHDIVDGAPAARFVGHFRELVENCYGLNQLLTATAKPEISEAS